VCQEYGRLTPATAGLLYDRCVIDVWGRPLCRMVVGMALAAAAFYSAAVLNVFIEVHSSSSSGGSSLSVATAAAAVAVIIVVGCDEDVLSYLKEH